MKESLRLPDDALSKMTELPTADLINEQIIVLIITGISSDADALHICDLLETLVENEQSIRDIEVLRNGNVVISITAVSYIINGNINLCA